VIVLYLVIFLPGLLLAGLIIGRQLFRPIQKLTRAATLISFGDYSQQVKIDSRDELGYLGDVFNEMVGKIVRERSRLADELHDGPVQVLASVNWKLDVAGRLLAENKAAEVRQVLDNSQQLLLSAVADIRKSIYELHRREISEINFLDIVKKHLEDFSGETGIKIKSRMILPGDIPVDSKIELYRVIGEILTNIKKHSHAGNLEFDLHLAGNSDGGPADLVLAITNDGKGFNPDKIYPGHFGLKSIRNRVKTLGGFIAISSAENSLGAKIVITVPVKPPGDVRPGIASSLPENG
jgi:signal transduction histidine kinase